MFKEIFLTSQAYDVETTHETNDETDLNIHTPQICLI